MSMFYVQDFSITPHILIGCSALSICEIFQTSVYIIIEHESSIYEAIADQNIICYPNSYRCICSEFSYLSPVLLSISDFLQYSLNS